MTPEPSTPRKFPVDPAWLALIVAALVLLLAIAWLFRVLPHKAAFAVAWAGARVAFHVFRFRRRETLRWRGALPWASRLVCFATALCSILYSQAGQTR